MSWQKHLACAIAVACSIAAPTFAAGQTSAAPTSATVPPLPAYLRVPDVALPLTTGSLPQPPSPFADDFDAVRAPLAFWASPTFWSGFYVGGQFSYSNADGDFSDATQGPIAYSLRELTLESEFAPSNWPVLGSASHSAAGFGGFAGYNFQYLKAVFGVEANYDQASLSLTAPNSPISRVTPADSSSNTYLVNITGNGTVTNLNFGTLRARGGWAFGNFLPYAFAGLAIGHANIAITETTSGQQNPPSGGGACSSSSVPPCVPFSFTGTAGKSSEWLYGPAVGAGLDVALTRNFFLRGEYEYVYFEPIDGVKLDINTVRVGAAVKF